MLVREWRQFRAERAVEKRVAILVGTKPRDPRRPAPTPAQPSEVVRAGDPRAVVREMLDGLKGVGALATYEAFAQFGHGEMLRPSLERALDVTMAH